MTRRLPIVRDMVRLIHYGVVAACVLVVLGFAGFVSDELRFGSDTQQAKLAKELDNTTLSGATEEKRARTHSKARELIDDSNDVLLAPFTRLVQHSKSLWVRRGVSSLLALLFYGLLVALIANSLPKPKTRSADWRTVSHR